MPRVPYGMRELFVETRWGRLAAIEAAPPQGVATRSHAVMAGGFLISKQSWVPAMFRLARQGYHVRAYDHLGMPDSGGTNNPDDPDAYTLDTLTEDLLTVARDLAGSRPVHILGSCFGGFVARAAALSEPDLARSLTLLSSGPTMADSADPGFARRMASVASTSGQAGMGRLVTSWLPEKSERSFDAVESGLAATALGHLIGFPRSVDAASFPSEALRALDIPKLVVYGVHDNVWLPSVQEAMGQRIGARTVSVDHAQHAPLLDRPATTAAVLMDFLEYAENVMIPDQGRAHV